MFLLGIAFAQRSLPKTTLSSWSSVEIRIDSFAFRSTTSETGFGIGNGIPSRTWPTSSSWLRDTKLTSDPTIELSRFGSRTTTRPRRKKKKKPKTSRQSNSTKCRITRSTKSRIWSVVPFGRSVATWKLQDYFRCRQTDTATRCLRFASGTTPKSFASEARSQTAPRCLTFQPRNSSTFPSSDPPPTSETRPTGSSRSRSESAARKRVRTWPKTVTVRFTKRLPVATTSSLPADTSLFTMASRASRAFRWRSKSLIFRPSWHRTSRLSFHR